MSMKMSVLFECKTNFGQAQESSKNKRKEERQTHTQAGGTSIQIL